MVSNDVFTGNIPKTHIYKHPIYLITQQTPACERQADEEAAQRETGGIKEPEGNGKFNFL